MRPAISPDGWGRQLFDACKTKTTRYALLLRVPPKLRLVRARGRGAQTRWLQPWLTPDGFSYREKMPRFSLFKWAGRTKAPPFWELRNTRARMWHRYDRSEIFLMACISGDCRLVGSRRKVEVTKPIGGIFGGTFDFENFKT